MPEEKTPEPTQPEGALQQAPEMEVVVDPSKPRLSTSARCLWVESRVTIRLRLLLLRHCPICRPLCNQVREHLDRFVCA
jgi:hypothetical protein